MNKTLKPGNIIRRINSRGKTNQYRVKKIRGDIVFLYDLENNIDFETKLDNIFRANYEIEK